MDRIVEDSNTGSGIWRLKRMSNDSNGPGGSKVLFPQMIHLVWWEMGV